MFSAALGFAENMTIGIILVLGLCFNSLQISLPSLPERSTSSNIRWGLKESTFSYTSSHLDSATTSNPFVLNKSCITAKISKSSSKIKIFFEAILLLDVVLFTVIGFTLWLCLCAQAAVLSEKRAIKSKHRCVGENAIVSSGNLKIALFAVF